MVQVFVYVCCVSWVRAPMVTTHNKDMKNTSVAQSLILQELPFPVMGFDFFSLSTVTLGLRAKR